MTLSWLPARISPDARLLLFTRGLRGFADGAVSVLLASYLTHLGLSSFDVGVIVTGTLLGSAALTLAVGLAAGPLRRKYVLLGAAVLMFATGLAFTGVTGFWPILVVAVVGTMNPSAGDVSLFLPAEQAALAETVEARELTGTFAWYNVSGALAGALGALASGLPAALARRTGSSELAGERLGFVVYAVVAVAVAVAYLRLTPAIEAKTGPARRAPLTHSRRIVIELSLLFSLDSFGGGLVVQSLLALWLARRFDLPPETTGLIFFAAGVLNAGSQLLSPRLAARIGRIPTMVYTHLPANVFLVLAGLMPTAPLAILFLLLRASLSQMDVPARQSFVMAVVPPEERAAAASVTNVPRSLASALSPAIAGLLMARSSFGWPLVAAGLLKILYDLILLAQFRSVKPSDELG